MRLGHTAAAAVRTAAAAVRTAAAPGGKTPAGLRIAGPRLAALVG